MISYYSSTFGSSGLSGVNPFPCGNLIQPLESASVRTAFHPKGSKISVAFTQDFDFRNLAQSLMYLYMTGYRATWVAENGNAPLSDVYGTGLCDLGIYYRNGSILQSELRQTPPVYTELDSVINTVRIANGGNYPLTGVYGTGYDDYKTALYPRMFANRNSTHGNATKAAGTAGGANNNNDITCIKNLTKLDWISKANTFRWVYYSEVDPVGGNSGAEFYSGTFEEGVVDATNKINDAFDQDGVFISFGHWHWAATDYFLRHLNTVNSVISGRDAFKGTFQELGVYHFIKETIDNVSLSGSSVTIDYTIKDNTRPYDRISTDLLWIELNLAGTAFEGGFISINGAGRIIEKSTDLYAVGVSLDFLQTQKVLTISSAVDDGAYDVTSIPSVSVSGNNITSDQPIKYTLFSRTNAQADHEVIIEEYNHSFSSSHTILETLDLVNRKYIIGFMNEYGVSGRYDIN